MFPGVLALVGRSIRVDARSLQPHVTRLGLMAAVYVSLCVALWNAAWFGAPGLRFFYWIAYLNITFMTLLGISFFSTSITEEKEEDTLGLMLMAGISPLGILIGKSGGRLLQALLLTAVQYPFTLLAVTMGGVTPTQVGAVYLGLSAYMILLAGLGLLCSTLGYNNRAAAALMIIGLALYALVPLLARDYLGYVLQTSGLGVMTIRSSFWLTLLHRISRFSVFNQLGTILTTGFGDNLWSWQVVSNAVTGVVCFGLSWALFGAGTRQTATDASTRGLVSRGRRLFRWFSPGRTWVNPFVWKDFHFVSGGVGLILVRLVFCAGLWEFAVLTDGWGFGNRSGGWENIITFFQMFLSLAVSIDAGAVMARSLHDEIRGQTLGSLMMLPRSTVAVIYSKFAGAMLGWLPGALINLLVTYLTDWGRHNLGCILTRPGWFCVSTFFVLMPHLVAVSALFLRWGAIPVGMAITIGLFFGTLSSIVTGPDEGTGLPIGITILIASSLCHFVILRRIRKMAAR